MMAFMMNPEMLEAMAAMVPPSLGASLKVLGTVIPSLAEQVISGDLSPEDAADHARAELVVVFEEMKNNGNS